MALTIEPTHSANETLNAFHLKVLRNILELKTTYKDRTTTNQKIFETAYNVLQTDNEKKPVNKNSTNTPMKRQIRPVSDICWRRISYHYSGT